MKVPKLTCNPSTSITIYWEGRHFLYAPDYLILASARLWLGRYLCVNKE